MSYTPDLEQLLLRCVAIEQEAIPTADAKPYAFHVQDGAYFTNRLSDVALSGDGEDYDIWTVQVQILFVAGNLTENYAGEPELIAVRAVAPIVQAFNEREYGLQSAAYPTAMLHMMQARLTVSGGIGRTETGTSGAQQVAVSFTLTAQFQTPLDQDYL